ncbi:uncharacterized protein BDFB_006455, partial [Asbolus verrucosus]
LLPGFLSRGVKSETVQKSADSNEEPLDYDDEILKENLHGLLREESPRQLRRSSRLSKKTQNLELTSSSYYHRVISNAESKPLTRSKSIFKEIKEKYAQKIEIPINHDFGAKIFAKLNSNFALKDSSYYKGKIRDEIVTINEILSGKLDPVDMSMNRKRHYHEEDKENYPIKYPYVPQSKWVFQTPPNRKLNYNHAKAEDNCIKPAILETCNDSKVVYEVNNKINVDFSNYSHRQEIDIDKRYMVEVANLPNSDGDITFKYREQEEQEKKFQFIQSDPYELENHFLSLTCRPKKVSTTASRIQNLKRKRDIFEPEAGCSTELETINEFDSSFTFINNLSNMEESFTFKFTADDGATTGHLFDFEGNKKDTFNFNY